MKPPLFNHLSGLPLLKLTQTGYGISFYNGRPDRWLPGQVKVMTVENIKYKHYE